MNCALKVFSQPLHPHAVCVRLLSGQRFMSTRAFSGMMWLLFPSISFWLRSMYYRRCTLPSEEHVRMPEVFRNGTLQAFAGLRGLPWLRPWKEFSCKTTEQIKYFFVPASNFVRWIHHKTSSGSSGKRLRVRFDISHFFVQSFEKG